MENTNAFGISAQRRRLSFFESSAHDLSVESLGGGVTPSTEN
jgi:hypothetical protein